MPLGFNSNRSLEIPLDGLTPEQFIMLAADTAHKLGWGIYFINATGFTATTSEVTFAPRDKVFLRIANGIAYLKSQPTSAKMHDPNSQTRPELPPRGARKSTIQDFAGALAENRKLYPPDQLTAAYERNKQNLAPADQDVSSQSPSGSSHGFFSYFIPRKGYFITPIIIDLNIIIWILMVLSGVNAIEPDGESLIAWGANFRPYTLDGQWWRLLTCCFLHIGIFHLLFNMYAFAFIGELLEPLLKRWKFTIAYLLTGIAASATSLVWHKEAVVSAGASGAIFGMTGVLLALLTTNLIHPETRKPLLRSIGFFVLYNLAFGTMGAIDNAAHVGGLISGIIIGYILYPTLKKNRPPTDPPAPAGP